MVAHPALPSMEFSRQEYWRGLPFPSPGIFQIQESNLSLLRCRQILYRLSHEWSLIGFKWWEIGIPSTTWIKTLYLKKASADSSGHQSVFEANGTLNQSATLSEYWVLGTHLLNHSGELLSWGKHLAHPQQKKTKTWKTHGWLQDHRLPSTRKCVWKLSITHTHSKKWNKYHPINLYIMTIQVSRPLCTSGNYIYSRLGPGKKYGQMCPRLSW